MKVGIVLFGDLTEPSGGYVYDRHAVEALTRAGHEVTIVSQPAGLTYREQRRLGRREAAHLTDGVCERIVEQAFDMLIIDELNHAATQPWLRTLRRRVSDTPIVALVHHLRADEGLSRRWSRGVEARFLRCCDAWLCNSTVTLRRVYATAGTVRASGVSFPGVGEAGYTEGPGASLRNDSALRGGRELEEGALRLLFVGTLIPRKNLTVLLRAVARVPDVTLRIVGDTTHDRRYTGRVTRLIRRLGLARRATLCGRLDSRRLVAAYRWADLFAAPSRYEGFGIVYLEAMAHGLPVIASRAGGAKDLVTHGRDGFLVPPSSPRAIAATLKRLCADRASVAQLGKAAGRRAARHESWERSMDGAVRFLEDVRAQFRRTV